MRLKFEQNASLKSMIWSSKTKWSNLIKIMLKKFMSNFSKKALLCYNNSKISSKKLKHLLRYRNKPLRQFWRTTLNMLMITSKLFDMLPKGLLMMLSYGLKMPRVNLMALLLILKTLTILPMKCLKVRTLCQ